MDGSKLLVQFLVNNKGPGPYAEETDVKDIQPGDIIQLSFGGAPHFDHSPVVVQVGSLQVFGTYLWQPIRTTGIIILLQTITGLTSDLYIYWV